MPNLKVTDQLFILYVENTNTTVVEAHTFSAYNNEIASAFCKSEVDAKATRNVRLNGTLLHPRYQLPTRLLVTL